MKRSLVFGLLGMGLFTINGCATGDSIWSRDPYIPAPQTIRGSQTYSPKTIVSPYQNNGPSQFPATSGGSTTSGGSGAR